MQECKYYRVVKSNDVKSSVLDVMSCNASWHVLHPSLELYTSRKRYKVKVSAKWQVPPACRFDIASILGDAFVAVGARDRQ